MNAAAIPVELRDRPQWVVWRLEERDGKPTKVPYQAAHPRRNAKADDPATWGTFDQAIAVDGVDGVGYVFSADDPYTGIDLDACVDIQTGELHPDAAEILAALDGYQERSPSGAGMHAIVAGRLNGDRNRTGATPWGGVFEVYDRRRFFTVTGKGAGTIADRQAQLDELVARMFGAASRNGAGPSDASQGRSGGVDVQAILDRHQDLARIAARKGTKPKGGTASDWDFMLGCRAAEYGYGDDVLVALIRHARRMHGEDKGERHKYAETTVGAVRRKVGPASADVGHDELLAELTKAIRVDGQGRRVVETFVAGHGNTGSATIMLDDGYTIEFDRFEHVAQPSKLADQLATTVGIVTDFSKSQARRVAALVRLTASRQQELRDYGVFVDEAMRLLDLAQPVEFDQADQESRWLLWQRLRNVDPSEPPDGDLFETDAMRARRESPSAEAYARRMLVPVDRKTGVRFVHAGWLQQFMRLRLGPSTTPHRTKQVMLRAGWQMRGRDGRIKATAPDGGEQFALVFYLVPRGWVERQTEQVQ